LAVTNSGRCRAVFQSLLVNGVPIKRLEIRSGFERGDLVWCQDSQEINGGIGDAEQFRGGPLERARCLVCGEVDGRSLEALTLELVA
jgi:hypothetical protein